MHWAVADFHGGKAAVDTPVDGSCVLSSASDVCTWLRNAFEQSSDGIFVMTPEGRTLLYNRAMARMTGWDLEHVCVTPWFDRLFAAEDAREEGERLSSAIQEGLNVQSDVRIVRADGSRAWLSFTMQPLQAGDRQLVLGTVTDIGDRMRLESERAQAIASLEQAYEDLEVLQDLSERAMASLDLDELFEGVLNRLVETTGAAKAVVLLLEGDRLVTRAGVGMEDQVRHGFTMNVGEGFAGVIAHTGDTLYMEDAQTDERMRSPFVRRQGVRSMYGVPIMRRGNQMIGVLLIGWLGHHDQDDREMRLLEIVANRVGSAIYNAVLYRQTERERTLSRALNEIDSDIGSTLNVDEILRRVTCRMKDVVQASGSGVALADERGLVIQYGEGALRPLEGYTMSDQVHSALADASLPEGVLRVTNGFEDPRANTEVTRRYGLGSFLGAPLYVRGEFLGAVLLTWSEPVAGFNDLDVDFIARVGASVSLAVANARLYEAQAAIARKLQEALLAVPESVESLRVGHLYRSATEQAEVGGDFYDVFLIDPATAAVLIGDVSGHGVEAATLTALCKSVARAFAQEEDPPSEILRKSNEVITRNSPTTVFVTMFLAILNTHTGEMKYCSAGHPPPLIRRVASGDGSATVAHLSGLCPLLGAFRGLQYVDHYEHLSKGDTLLMYTDGLLEARGPDGRFFGSEGAAHFLAGLEEPDAEDLPRQLFEEVLQFTGGKLADDLAILAVSLER